MKNNKLIAEFMGRNVITEDDIRANKNPISTSHDGDLEEDLEYHSSWDWLMPVAEKCLCTDEKTDGQHYFINDALLTCNIEEVFDRVVEFIKRTNLNQQ